MEELVTSLIATHPDVAETPWFRQMYLGEWVTDVSARCYKFNRVKNVFDSLPKYKGGQWHGVLGVDLGYSPDPSAFVLCVYHDFDPCLYIIESWKQWKMDITDVAHRIEHYELRYHSLFGSRIEAMVIDGANKQAVEEMRRRHNLDLQAADKRGKDDFIELMNAEFQLGKIKVHSTATCDGMQNGTTADNVPINESLSLADEYEGLIWDPKTVPGHPQWKPGIRRKEHPRCPNHLCDAGLYSWRWTYQYLSSMPAKPAEYGSPEWIAQEIERMREQSEVEMESRKPLQETVGLGDSENWDPNLV